jgi:hypothetical protein
MVIWDAENADRHGWLDRTRKTRKDVDGYMGRRDTRRYADGYIGRGERGGTRMVIWDAENAEGHGWLYRTRRTRKDADG